MSVLVVQFRVDPADVAQVQAALTAMCEALAVEQPAGTRFAACKLADGVSFLNILQLDEGAPNPLPEIPAAREFQQRMIACALGDEPPAAAPVTVVGSYGLLEEVPAR
ncbi:hypothetical protein [Pseudonocardia thermophila]|jgi:hypothetical protein|uniref:hypothetical protein n=1 Tax=Pseudonocardia thermophila TaxID=1848 RepID=UPI00248E9ECB|nr:hypothetical protein [Pseudonocardia thermophila]